MRRTTGPGPVLVALVLVSTAVASGQTAMPASSLTPTEIATRVQAHYDQVRDFQGEFMQTYEGGVLRTRSSERGTVTVKRPGRMRWVYTAPERKEFVSNGTTLYAYFPLDRQVIVSPAPRGADTTPALFLTGQAHLVRDFDASAMTIPGAAPWLVGVKLVAKRPDPDFEWLAIGVDPKTFQIQFLAAQDRQGGKSSFQFTKLKENTRPSDTVFEFRVPKGVDVIQQ